MRNDVKCSDSITVRVLKHDGVEYRRWNARIAERNDSLIVLDAEFDVDVTHDLLGKIQRGTRTVEYYWLDRWYNIFRFLSGAGETRLYYCNINTPPAIEGGLLTYIDLDIDILVQPDLSYQVLDLEEFAMNAERYGYSEEEKKQAQAAVDELISLIQTRHFPFAKTNKSALVSSVVD
jgi:protein associated with RNAse G/E